jgi:hypothetical protein
VLPVKPTAAAYSKTNEGWRPSLFCCLLRLRLRLEVERQSPADDREGALRAQIPLQNQGNLVAEDRGFEPLRMLTQHDFQFDSGPSRQVRPPGVTKHACLSGPGRPPLNWGELSPKLKPCSPNKRQSPETVKT